MSSWRRLAYAAARPLLFRFDSERIHRLTVDGLRIAGGNRLGRAALRVAGGAPRRIGPWADLAGLRFRNRVGLGAGFDKDAIALRGWAALGLGFVEVGTVTAGPQPGAPRPRLFRLVADEALVNRMGFNNAGAVAVARQVMLARRHLPRGFVVGASIGRGRDTTAERAVDDYLACHRLLAPVADYLAVNVSSPNTAGLRDLQQPEALEPLLAALRTEGERRGTVRPLLVKVAPDLGPEELRGVVAAAVAGGAAGLIVGNTALSRPRLRSPLAAEPGGLSGAPLLAGTLERVRLVREAADGLLVVASGGLASAADVAAAYRAGADLVQLWTGLVYAGPGLIGEAVAVPFRGAGADWYD